MNRLLWPLFALALAFGIAVPARAVSPALPLDDTYGFFSFWNTYDGELLFGAPVTGPLEENSTMVQYFERARFEYHPDQPDAVTLGLLGRERTAWRTFDSPPPAVNDGLSFDSTAYSISGVFRTFWERKGGLPIFGYPISAPLWEQTATGRFRVQYFERALMIQHPLYAGTDQEIELAPLGHEVAAMHGLVEGSSAQPNAALYAFDPLPPAAVVTAAPEAEAAEATAEPTTAPQPTTAPSLPIATPQPTAPPPPPTAPPPPPPATGKWIDVDLSAQWLYAYEGDVEVFNAPVATGKDGFDTPTGEYSIYSKIPLQTMRGSINGESWVVPNVPHAMYINGSVALHGTYWHNLFGSGVRISHGCVNLPLDSAAWLYDWAPIGTPVTVHY